MNKLSYKWMLGAVILTLIILGTLWIYQVVILEKNYMATRYTLVKNQVDALAEAYIDQDESLFDSLIEEIFYGNNMTVEVLTPDGQVVYGNTGRGHMMPPRMLRGAYLSSVVELGEASTIITNQRFGSEILVYAKYLPHSNRILVGSMTLEPIKETIGLLQRQIIWLSIFLLMLAITLGFFISKLLLVPISKLNHSVNALASGNMDVHVSIQSKDEFGQLAENFNRMAESLKRVDNLRKDLVANVSHELRTPLAIIKGYAELIRDVHGEKVEKRTAYLNTIVDEADRLSAIVNNLLTLSQIQSGYQALKREQVSLIAFLHDMIEKHEHLAQKKGIDLFVTGVSEDHVVNWDESLMAQVFHNFLSNAINHTDRGGRVTIRFVGLEAANRIEIVDTGTGIEPEVIQHIWDRHYKGAGSKGSGIGLSIVSSILKAHGYTRGVTSALGSGSTFYFEMP